jgi:hypothetical protein
MRVTDWLSGLGHRLRSSKRARLSRRRAHHLAQFAAEVPQLEARCLLSEVVVIPTISRRRAHPPAPVGAEVRHSKARRGLIEGVPIPSTNPQVALSTIFWNGEAAPLDANGLPNIPSPAASGAAKTITITNYGQETIYPFLRTANTGQDPHSNNEYYDPQDLHTGEFREYVGYTAANGSEYLGLPSGASVTFQVPLVLWDGDNISLVTDGKYLTTPPGQPGATLFGYDPNARIAVAGTAPVSNNTWVQSSKNYPKGWSPLVMFYYATTAATVSDDAPSQPAEVTFRDPYLKKFIDDSFQTFPLINYDVTNVNKLAAPASMEGSNVPITSGAVASNNLKYYPPNEDFGWHGSDKNTATFDPLLQDFVDNAGKASIGAYFGNQKKGWPQFYNPDPMSLASGIPSGADLFDLSPVDAHGNVVHTSNYDANRWILSSSGGGAIQATAGGDPLNDPNATKLPLVFGPGQRAVFVKDVNSMEESGQPIDLTISTQDSQYQGVLGSLIKYDPSSSVRAYTVTKGGMDYSSGTYVKIVGGGGTGAEGDVHVVNGVIQSIGLNPAHAGSGYTSPPTVEIIDPTGKGTGAEATAAITGGTAVVKLANGRTLPTGVGLSYVFKRTGTDYASTAITNLWYSWAQYYVNLYKNFQPESAQGTLVMGSIGGGSPVLTNQIALASLPPTPLAVGMTVTAPSGIPAQTTILKIVGTTIYLSQIPDADTPMSQQYTFGKPQALPIDATSALYTQPYTLTFIPQTTPNANLFAGSVYESMAVQSVALPPSPYLPTTMNVVDHVIKFYAILPTYDQDWGTVLVGEARDMAKSILRGVYDYYQVPDQSKWYPNPSTATGGQAFNVYNLDPYVWFVHKVEGLTGYAFSVDDDVANPAATGPRDDDSNHEPSNLQIGFAGIKGTGDQSNAPPLGNQNEWFPTTPWGSIQTTATIGVQPDGPYKGYSVITLTDLNDDPPNPVRILNQIITPGAGQVGAYISAPGYIVPGTTLIYFPNGVTSPEIILSQNAISTPPGQSIPVTIDAAQMTIPKVTVENPDFAAPAQTNPPYYTVNPTDPQTFWTFAGTAGIAGSGSIYTKNNPAPVGTQVAFIQDEGGISQSVTLAANQAYAVSFLVAQQQLDNGSVSSQTLQVKVGDQVIGNFSTTGTNNGGYVLFTSDAFRVGQTGNYPITITGTNLNGGDNTALISGVQVTGSDLVPTSMLMHKSLPSGIRRTSHRRAAP